MADESDERTAQVGVGAVLYDLRVPERRECCSEGGRCLWHVTDILESVTHGGKEYVLWDGSHTARKYVHEEDLLYDGMFEPAGWQFPVGMKPAYHLTRNCGVHDNHDMMLEANRP